jgi:16S rRNA (guanine527-N7)-methyltransferase
MTRPVDWAALAQWATSSAGITLAPAQLAQLASYVDTLLLWNQKVALVSQRDAREIATKHVADSLFVAGYCAGAESLIDLGSGAGFPGLPIAIAQPAISVALLEARGRKVSFLEEVCRTASIRNALVLHARIEATALDPAHRGRYAIATARALSSMSEFAALARPFLGAGGRAVAMRSVGEPMDSSAQHLEEVFYQLPDGTPRRLVVARP